MFSEGLIEQNMSKSVIYNFVNMFNLFSKCRFCDIFQSPFDKIFRRHTLYLASFYLKLRSD